MKAALLAVAALIAAPLSAQTIAFVGGTVAIGDGSAPMPGGTVLVRDGRIVAAGASVAVPAGATVIDACSRSRGPYNDGRNATCGNRLSKPVAASRAPFCGSPEGLPGCESSSK